MSGSISIVATMLNFEVHSIIGIAAATLATAAHARLDENDDTVFVSAPGVSVISAMIVGAVIFVLPIIILAPTGKELLDPPSADHRANCREDTRPSQAPQVYGRL